MFIHEDSDAYQKQLKYPETYKDWCEQNDVKVKSNYYLDGNFFQYVVTTYKSTGELKQELCELVDLLIRKNLTHKKFIRYDNGEKDEMYSNALAKVFQYTIAGYDETKATAFVFFTTAIRNAFKEVLKDYYKQKNLARQLLKSRDLNRFIQNYDTQDICDFDESINDALEFMADEEEEETIFEMTEFFKQIKDRWDFKQIKMLEDENAPKFKRQYTTFNCFIPVHNFTEESCGLEYYSNINKQDLVKYAKKLKIPLDGNKDIKDIKKAYLKTLIDRSKGIVVEYFDLKLFNESNGIPPSYIQNRSMMVRKLGHQYVGVFSDEWEHQDDDGNNVGQKVIMKRIQDCFDSVLCESPISNGRYVRFSYIPLSELNENNMHPKVWFGLKDKREKRHIVPDQTPMSYLNWLNSEKNATRVYDACIMKQ